MRLLSLLTALTFASVCAASSGFTESDPDFDRGVPFDPDAPIGREISVPLHLRNGQEFELSVPELLRHGELLFIARWTSQEGQGRPFGKGNDGMLTDPGSPLIFPRAFNRISGPAAGACTGCHNMPRAGGGDVQGPVFVLGNRFDFTTFDRRDAVPTKGSLDERGVPATLQTVSNPRKSTGMFGSGFIEMLARQITADLKARAAACAPGQSCVLRSKGIDFGTLTHRADGTWDVSQVSGLPAPSLRTVGTNPPSLVIQPFFQSGAVISLRQFTNNAFTRLHGMQSEERFGNGIDQDRDGFVNELTRADMTAVSVFQAALPVPGRVIPRDPRLRAAIARGEGLFGKIGCASCHVPSLPLGDKGWVYSEPNPYNPPGNLRLSDGVQPLSVDLTSAELPQPRLRAEKGVVMVPAYTDLKLHDITTGLVSCASHPELINTRQCDGDVEALDQNEPAGTPAFFAGNRRFITRKLWGIANQHSFGHHGQYTTLREAVLAHAGEAAQSSAAFRRLDAGGQNAVIEFLKSLQILPAGTRCLVVDEEFSCKEH
jgi:hypothetical protein